MKLIHGLKFYTCSACAILLLAGQASRCPGQTVLVDFGNNAVQYRSIPVPNPAPKGHYWNSIQTGLLVTDMLDINNATTTINLRWHTPVGTDSDRRPAGDTTFA